MSVSFHNTDGRLYCSRHGRCISKTASNMGRNITKGVTDLTKIGSKGNPVGDLIKGSVHMVLPVSMTIGVRRKSVDNSAMGHTSAGFVWRGKIKPTKKANHNRHLCKTVTIAELKVREN